MQAGKTTFDNSVPGYILGVDSADGMAKFYIGDSTHYLDWDGTNLTITGGLSVGSITIPSAITDSFNVDNMGNMWIGATTFAAAPFSVSNTGALVATSATIAGYAPAVFSSASGTDSVGPANTPISIVHTITHGLGKRPNFISVTVSALDCPVPIGTGTLISYGNGWIFLGSNGSPQGGISVNIENFSGGGGVSTASTAVAINSISASGGTSGGTGNSSISVGNVTDTTFDITYAATVSSGMRSWTSPTVNWSVYG
jgi:hypothetical protein